MNPDLVNRVLWVLWPSFLVAAVAELIIFSMIDPVDLHIFNVPIEAERMPVYTVGFFFLWAITAAASALTVFLERSPFEVNRCPLLSENRPDGCPKQEGVEAERGCGS